MGNCIPKDKKTKVCAGLHGCESWTLTSEMKTSQCMAATLGRWACTDHHCELEGTQIRLNAGLYGDLAKGSDKIASRRLGLAGHRRRHQEPPWNQLVTSTRICYPQPTQTCCKGHWSGCDWSSGVTDGEPNDLDIYNEYLAEAVIMTVKHILCTLKHFKGWFRGFYFDLRKTLIFVTFLCAGTVI